MNHFLFGSSEVPAVQTEANGVAKIKVDSKKQKITWKVRIFDLDQPITGLHFHGPATITENNDVQIDMESKLDGSASVTNEQIKQIRDGLWYINVHTDAYPSGEIRGQVVEVTKY